MIEPDQKTDRESCSQGILLADCSIGAEHVSRSMAVELADLPITIHAIIVGPEDPDPAVNAIARQFNNSPKVIKTSRPDKEPFILELLDTGLIEIIFSYYGYRVRPRLLSGSRRGAVNIHPSVLPNNGGRHSAFWGIMDRTKLGATIHWMDENFDTGDIIGQATFEDDGTMTAEDVYQRQLDLCVELFRKYLPQILAGTEPRIPQPPEHSYHFNEDILSATNFKGEDVITMEQLLRLARATHFGPHGFYIQEGNRKFKVQASVSEMTD